MELTEQRINEWCRTYYKKSGKAVIVCIAVLFLCGAGSIYSGLTLSNAYEAIQTDVNLGRAVSGRTELQASLVDERVKEQNDQVAEHMKNGIMTIAFAAIGAAALFNIRKRGLSRTDG